MLSEICLQISRSFTLTQKILENLWVNIRFTACSQISKRLSRRLIYYCINVFFFSFFFFFSSLFQYFIWETMSDPKRDVIGFWEFLWASSNDLAIFTPMFITLGSNRAVQSKSVYKLFSIYLLLHKVNVRTSVYID